MSGDPSLILSEDVEGAPVRIGETVKVVSSAMNDSLNTHFLGRSGVVVALVYDEPRRQYPRDPLIQVRVEGLGDDLFFAEELELSAEWARQRVAELRQAEQLGPRGRLH